MEIRSPAGSPVGKKQPFYGKENSIRLIESVGELPIDGHVRTALELQKRIADDLFHPRRMGTMMDAELYSKTAAMRTTIHNTYETVARSILGDAAWEQVSKLPPMEAAQWIKALPTEQYAQMKALKRSMQTLRNELKDIEGMASRGVTAAPKTRIAEVLQVNSEVIRTPAERFIAPALGESGTLALTGTADEMLGLLSSRKKLVVERGGQLEQGWKITGKDAQGQFILQREGQTITARGESLIRNNLRAHIASPEELSYQARIMENVGFTREQTRFLLENGYSLPSNTDATSLMRLSAELPAIQEAIADIRSTLGQHPDLSVLLEKYLMDIDHPMSVTSYLKNPAQRKVLLSDLQELATSNHMNADQFETFIASMRNENHPLFRLNAQELSFTAGKPRSEILREQLLSKDKALFSMDDAPSAGQRASLDRYAEKLQENVRPQLKTQLQEVVNNVGIDGKDGFPAIAVRAKTAHGLVDKIKRMREGNAGRNQRPLYCLGDVPDAVGGRITVRDPEQLTRVMEELERTFGKDKIFEKDSFYVNQKKMNRPYRVVTYTVMVGETPCEIQLMTLSANVFSDLEHNMSYKPMLPASITQMHNFADLWRGVTARELRSLQLGLHT